MGDVVRFPIERRRVAPPPGYSTLPETLLENVTMVGQPLPFECTDLVHNFDEVPGRCRCGERFWDPDDPEAAS